jgi:uncharacterized membrane protein YccF (DUF307 family)
MLLLIREWLVAGGCWLLVGWLLVNVVEEFKN